MSIETELDAATKELLDNVAAEDAKRPDEPSLPFGEWARKNLFSSIPNGLLTVIFGLLSVFAYQRLLNFIFSEERTWNAVRVNLRNLFTASYPGSQYNRIWITLAIVFVLAGLSMGLMKTIGQGFSVKRISMWFMSTGAAIVAGILLRQPSVLKDENGLAQWVLPNGDFVARDETERLITVDADGNSLLGIGEEVSLIRESFGAAMADRSLWWLVGLVTLGIGCGLWFGLGDKVRRNTFVPAIPLGLGMIGAFISSVWWYGWGHYARDEAGELVIEPGALVASSTRVPFTILWFVLVAAYLIGRWIYKNSPEQRSLSQQDAALLLVIPAAFFLASQTDYPVWKWLVGLVLAAAFFRWILSKDAGTVRAIVNFSWLLTPFVTFFVILRDPDLDWDHVWSTHIPMAIAFMAIGGAILWALTNPSIGERGRLIAAGLTLFALYNWMVAFFGYDGFMGGHIFDRLPNIFGYDIGFTHMLQKARISFLLLGLAALVAHNFAGDARQRLRMVYAWVGLMAVVHYMATMINTAETVASPDQFAGGFVVTVYVAVFTMIFSFPLGIILALGRTSQMPLFRVMSTVYIEVVRGIPFITILFFFAVFVEFFLPEGMELAGLASAGIGFSLFSAAYLAENIRGGLQSIRRGQYEASDAMGLTTVQRTGFIVLPQALRASIPPLVGAMIATFKETSLLSIVGIIDFLRVANSSIPGQTDFVGVKREGLLFVCLIYWIGSYAMSKYSQRLEKQLGVGER